MKTILKLACGLGWMACLAANAREPIEPSAATDTFEQLWGYATLYKDDTNPYLEELKLRGRYHGQYWNVNANQGNQSHWEDRRSRFGLDAKFFDKHLEARIDFQSNDGFADLYDGLVDAYLRWKPNSWLSLTAGKTQPLIGQFDWLESSNIQRTFERSQIFNQLAINRATALTIQANAGKFTWRAGVYSNDTPNSTADPFTKIPSGSWGDGEFGQFSGGVSFSLGAAYDLKHQLQLEKASFHLDWLHSNRKPGDLVLGKYNDILSTTFIVKQGAAAAAIEAYFASGGDGTNSNVFGFFIEPTYDIVPGKLQLVGRYTHSNSTGPFGVVAQTRYERPVASRGGLGDCYDAIYGGFQYFIHGDKLKLMAGAEWSMLGQVYSGATLLSGIRFSF